MPDFLFFLLCLFVQLHPDRLGGIVIVGTHIQLRLTEYLGGFERDNRLVILFDDNWGDALGNNT